MDKEYRELLHKYKIAVTQIKEMEDRAKEKDRMWNEYKATQDVANDHARKLCELILAKDRKEMTLGTAKSWHSYSTDQLILKAMDSFIMYAADRTALLNSVMKESQRRGREIEGLQEQIELMMRSGVDVEEAKTQLEKKAQEETVREKLNAKTLDAVDKGEVTLIIEDGDMSSEDFIDVEQLAGYSVQKQLTPKEPVMAVSKKVQESIQRAKEAATVPFMDDLMKRAEKFKDLEWQILEIVGAVGISRHKAIVDYAVKTIGVNETAVKRRITTIKDSGFFEKVDLKLPLTPKLALYYLSDAGKLLYKNKFGKEPIISEYHQIIKIHDNADHGFAIMDLKAELEKYDEYVEVHSDNRSNPISVTIKGKQLKYIPDLICETKTGKKEYIEYERGTHHQSDFNEKLDKMCRVTKVITLIVPNKDELRPMKNKVEAWAKTKDESSLKNYVVRIGTCADIRDKQGYAVRYDFKLCPTPIER